ncbi:chitinase-3-like protein 1 [Amblyomma americanum]
MRQLKKRNPKLKFLLAVGGPHDPVEKYWKLFPQVYVWKDLTLSLSQWMRTYEFDGVVLDFFSGHTTVRDSVKRWDQARFIHPFVRQVNRDFQETGMKWSISLTLPAFDSTTHHLFDIAALTHEVNFFIVKTSDCLEFPKGSFLNVTRSMDLTDIDRAELIVEKGAPRERIILDIALSGRTYSATGSASGGHTVFTGHAGPYTKQQGFLGFFEVCDHIKSGWKRERFGEEACSFLNTAEQYVAYEDDESIRRKARMVMGRTYHGAAVRTVDLDDFTGACTEKSHLLKALRSTFDITSHYVHFYYDPRNATWWEELQSLKNLKNSSSQHDSNSTSTSAANASSTPASSSAPQSSSSPPSSSTPAQRETVTSYSRTTHYGERDHKWGDPFWPFDTYTTETSPTAATAPTPLGTTLVTSSTAASTSQGKPSAESTPQQKTPPTAATPPPLATTVELKTTSPQTSTTPSSPPPPATAPVTQKSVGDICKGAGAAGLAPHETDCTKYYHCVHSTAHLRTCAPNTIFDIGRQICNWPALANRPECPV